MTKHRIWAVILILAAAGLAFFIYSSQKPGARFPFRLGLDLSGGTELTYRADVSKVASGDVESSMDSLKDVIERRVNLFGVSEPVVLVEHAGSLSKEERLIVGLPGVTDINEAIAQIGKTPVLEFRLLTGSAEDLQKFEESRIASSTSVTFSTSSATSTSGKATSTGQKSGALAVRPTASTSAAGSIDTILAPTGLTGRLLSHSALQFNQTTGRPVVELEFNAEGRDLFAKITRENTGKILAIVLDGKVISAPRISEEIPDGKAVINGTFSADEAKTLVRDLNYGALPVPIALESTQTIGATLGGRAVDAGVKAGIYGLSIVALFLILWYRLPGFMAAVSLVIYILITLSLYKLIPVTLSAAGIAGFILSIGIAVDANILIFERMKEELRRGKSLEDAVTEGFGRAWTSIRDGNISGLIISVILFWFGTSLVKGFALTLGLGIVTSLFTAITVTRTFLKAFGVRDTRAMRTLFGNGLYVPGREEVRKA